MCECECVPAHHPPDDGAENAAMDSQLAARGWTGRWRRHRTARFECSWSAHAGNAESERWYERRE
jgi:hypothetical protein